MNAHRHYASWGLGLVVVAAGLSAGCPRSIAALAKDVPYVAPVATDRQRLDIYGPPDGEDLPVVAFVHGGGWAIGNRAHVNYKPAAFVDAGYLFVSIGYRLSPEVVHPGHVSDVGAAVAWLRAHIADYGGDPDRIFLMGHSAGAHLVALVSTDETYLTQAGAGLDAIKGVIPLDGAGYDIPLQVEMNPRIAWMFEAAFGEDPAGWPDASPVNHVEADKGIPPFLLIHAGDRIRSEIQCYALADQLEAAGVTAEVKHAKDRDHASLNRRIGLPGDETTQWILEFLDGLAD
ncbi:MAG: alpha/beta hydrolase fold domain-containing protein [Nitrospiraceae bacterium]|nr:alpha/beta hydrolase fold domain-containing protein [Nitrospiraceae bacterium]